VSVPADLHAIVQSARSVAARGELRTAAEMIDHALDATRSALGVDHPEVLTATRLLARLHTDLSELPDARRLLEEALAAGHHRLGEDHPIMLGLAYDLAVIADELGNRHEARRNYTLLARLGPEVLGREHEYVAAAYRYLGVPIEQPAQPPPPPAAEAPAATPPRPFPAPPPHHAQPPPPPRYEPEVPPPPWYEPGAPPSPWYEPGAPLPDDDPLDDRGDPRPGRAPMLILAAIAVMALLGGVIAAVGAFRAGGDRSAQEPTAAPTAPATSEPAPPSGPPAAAPTGVSIRDAGTSVTLSWTDPSTSQVAFLIAGGQRADQLRPVGQTVPGETTFTLNGLNSKLDYCFTVAAVYDVNQVALSDLVCTKRTAAPTPTSRRPSPVR